MKKFASLLMTVALLATMLSVFSVPASAEESSSEVMTETGTRHVELIQNTPIYIAFNPSLSGDYTFISEISENTSNKPHLLANLYCGNEKVSSDSVASAGNGNFCISYYFETGKTYRLEIKLGKGGSCSADVSLLKEVSSNNSSTVKGDCIISKPGNYEREYFVVNQNSSIVIGTNVALKVTRGFANHGKIEISGKLDLSQIPDKDLGEINVGKYGLLVEPDPQQAQQLFVDEAVYDINNWEHGSGVLPFGYEDNNENASKLKGSTLSEGSIWIIVAVAVVILAGVATLIVVKKKKKPATAGGTDNTDEE